MTFGPNNFDFTERDFSAYDTRLKDLVSSVFSDITDLETINFINLIRKKFAFTSSLNNYYLHASHREAFTATMTQRRSAINHGRRQGYELAAAGAATADLVCTMTNGPLAGTVTIPIADVVRTLEVTDPIRGELQTLIQFLPGEVEKTLSWRHALSKSSSFSPTGIKNETFFLPDGPYLDGSASFTTPAGAWTKVDNFLLSDETSRHFVVLVDQNDKGTIKVGDGQNGAKIDGGAFTISYETGGGEDGNVEQNSLTKLETAYTDSLGNRAYFDVTNASRATGGTARESVDQARVNIPANRTLPPGTMNRTDFEIRAEEVVGIGRALMLSSDEDITVPENEGRCYIIPSSGGDPSDALIASVEQTFVEHPMPITFTVYVVGATYQVIAIDATIWIADGFSQTAVKATVLANLGYQFEPMISAGSPVIGQYEETEAGILIPYSIGMKNPLVDFGYNQKDEDGNPSGETAWSDVFNIVRDSTGVRKVGAGADEFLLNGVRDDVPTDNFKFPQLGAVILRNGATGTVI